MLLSSFFLYFELFVEQKLWLLNYAVCCLKICCRLIQKRGVQILGGCGSTPSAGTLALQDPESCFHPAGRSLNSPLTAWTLKGRA